MLRLLSLVFDRALIAILVAVAFRRRQHRHCTIDAQGIYSTYRRFLSTLWLYMIMQEHSKWLQLLWLRIGGFQYRMA